MTLCRGNSSIECGANGIMERFGRSDGVSKVLPLLGDAIFFRIGELGPTPQLSSSDFHIASNPSVRD
jgi:hypothetical protein